MEYQEWGAIFWITAFPAEDVWLLLKTKENYYHYINQQAN
jgi:hypothetical protein